MMHKVLQMNYSMKVKFQDKFEVWHEEHVNHALIATHHSEEEEEEEEDISNEIPSYYNDALDAIE